ncbi:AI-2E family transporter [Streptomyces sp. NBC_00448]|uniref:AI-2E family transporter n=1 Tax=Streptomyces sp. NBC_00448 TaxID=2903652 RepID=UPI002E1B6715
MHDTPAQAVPTPAGPRLEAPDPLGTGEADPEAAGTGESDAGGPKIVRAAGRSAGSSGTGGTAATDDVAAVDDTAAAGTPAGRAARPRRLVGMAAAGQSWFRTGFGLALGAILAWLVARTVLRLSELLTLLLLAVFIAVSLETLVGGLVRRGLRRGWSVAVVVAGFAALLAGFLALLIPPVTAAVDALTTGIPRWRRQLRDHHSTLGRLEDHYHVIEKAQQQLGSGGASEVAGGVVGAGQMVINVVTSAVIVITVTLYLMAALPTIKQFCHRFVPGSRRPRVEAVTEEILSQVGRYMLGNIATSAIAGVATFAWCAAIGVPYPAALGFFVALMDMVPIVGSTVGGIVVSLVALIVSFPVALATAAFYVGFRIAEDYLIMPRAMKFAVDVHPVVTVVAVLAGGSLLGVIGGLVAIPAAVALGIVLDEYVFPRTDAA